MYDYLQHVGKLYRATLLDGVMKEPAKLSSTPYRTRSISCYNKMLTKIVPFSIIRRPVTTRYWVTKRVQHSKRHFVECYDRDIARLVGVRWEGQGGREMQGQRGENERSLQDQPPPPPTPFLVSPLRWLTPAVWKFMFTLRFLCQTGSWLLTSHLHLSAIARFTWNAFNLQHRLTFSLRIKYSMCMSVGS